MAQQTKGNFFAHFYAKHPIISHMIFICLAILLLGWISMIFLGFWTHHGSTAIVPDMRRMPYDQAYDKLKAEGFKVEIADSVYNDTIPPGTVTETWPRPGAVVKPGREIYLTITSFEPRKVKVAMPLKDVSSRQAMSYLESLGIKNIRLESVPSQFADLVLGATYKGKEVTADMMLPVNALVVLKVGVVQSTVPVDVENADSVDHGNIYGDLPDLTDKPAPKAEKHVEPEDDPDDPFNSSFYD